MNLEEATKKIGELQADVASARDAEARWKERADLCRAEMDAIKESRDENLELKFANIEKQIKLSTIDMLEAHASKRRTIIGFYLSLCALGVALSGFSVRYYLESMDGRVTTAESRIFQFSQTALNVIAEAQKAVKEAEAAARTAGTKASEVTRIAEIATTNAFEAKRIFEELASRDPEVPKHMTALSPFQVNNENKNIPITAGSDSLPEPYANAFEQGKLQEVVPNSRLEGWLYIGPISEKDAHIDSIREITPNKWEPVRESDLKADGRRYNVMGTMAVRGDNKPTKDQFPRIIGGLRKGDEVEMVAPLEAVDGPRGTRYVKIRVVETKKK